MAIEEFRGPTRWLSNFQKVSIVYEGIRYPTTEHAYQAAKTLDKGERELIASLRTAAEAKKLGQRITLRPDWESVRVQVMLDVNRLKFQDPLLRQKLLDTGNEELVEGNTWNDTFWGVCRGVGKNNLGRVLMKVREEIRDSLRSI
jgi:ribA/ribD-fused uncharacterized protein